MARLQGDLKDFSFKFLVKLEIFLCIATKDSQWLILNSVAMIVQGQ